MAGQNVYNLNSLNYSIFLFYRQQVRICHLWQSVKFCLLRILTSSNFFGLTFNQICFKVSKRTLRPLEWSQAKSADLVRVHQPRVEYRGIYRQSPIFSSVTKTSFYSTLCKYSSTTDYIWHQSRIIN